MTDRLALGHSRRRLTAARAVVPVALATTALACSHADKSAATGATAAATPSLATAAPVDSGLGKVHLVVTGGPHAGSYDAVMHDGGCSANMGSGGSWTTQYTVETPDSSALSTLQIQIPDAVAATKGTRAFHMTAGFGPSAAGQGEGGTGTRYDVDTRAGAPRRGGTGSVTVTDWGAAGRVTFQARTAAGVALNGTIDCNGVARSG